MRLSHGRSRGGPRPLATALLPALLTVSLLLLGSAERPAFARGSKAGREVPARAAQAQRAGPDRVASYRLDAVLDGPAKQVRGSGRITYRNSSQEALGDVWLRLYMNAFRSRETVWMREALQGFRGSEYDPSASGWIRLEELTRADTGENLLSPGQGDTEETIIRVPLGGEPLAPGGTLELDVRWTTQLPRVFARTGWAPTVEGTFFMVGQWYPKLAVYDRGRWDAEPWHANAEFFHDYGDYELTLTVPPELTTGASGVQVSEETLAEGKRVRYRAEGVTDVGWTGWAGFRRTTHLVEAAGQVVELELLLPPTEEAQRKRHVDAASLALDFFGRWYGAYPWPRLTVVVPPSGAEGAGGMEYPTLVTTGGSPDLPLGLGAATRELEVVTVHEIAHQWFPFQVQSNEAAEPWLDEGFADYLTIRALNARYGRQRSFAELPFGQLGYESVQRASFVAAAPRQPLSQAAWSFADQLSYAATAYGKGSTTLLTLERQLGDDRFTEALRDYLERWRWRHPTTADLEEALGRSLDDRLMIERFFQAFVRGGQNLEFAVASLTSQRAVIERRGSPFPVEILVSSADGSQRREYWDGEAPRLEIQAGDSPLRAVQVDPDARLGLQLSRIDDARTLEPDFGTTAALATRWLAVVQALLQLAGQIG